MQLMYFTRVFTNFILTSFCIFTFSCVIDLSGNEDNALKITKEIRSAQQKYKERYGNYGSLKQLANNGLIANEFSKSDINKGYKFIIYLVESKYKLIAIPQFSSSDNKTGDVCLFLDESGIIRATYNADMPANESSEPIKNQ